MSRMYTDHNFNWSADQLKNWEEGGPDDTYLGVS